jgi:protein-tyrosine sulfotransferase
MTFSIYLRRKLRLTDNRYLFIIVVLSMIVMYLVVSRYEYDDPSEFVNLVKLDDSVHGNSSHQAYGYDKNLPVIFVGGVPRSGTTLMRAVLDAHPSIRCGEETRVLPRILGLKGQWYGSQREKDRLANAGISEDVLDEAIRSFVLEIIVRHGKPADHFCNKDPLVLRYTNYVAKLLPKSKFILMIRDARATVHSIISRKVTITGFNHNSYSDCFKRWNSIIENMFSQCVDMGKDTCLPVYYEQLVLHPEKELRNIFQFLKIQWNDAVLKHEEFIGNEISLSKLERSTDQVIKPINLEALSKWIGQIPEADLKNIDETAPMLSKLGYDTKSANPNYGEADAKIQENTRKILENKEYWHKLAEKYAAPSPENSRL